MRIVWRVEARHLDEFGQDAGDDRVGRYVLGHDGARDHDRAVADRHAWDDRHSGAGPYFATDHDRRRDHVRAPVGIHTVVEGCQHAAVADERAVPDRDARTCCSSGVWTTGRSSTCQSPWASTVVVIEPFRPEDGEALVKRLYADKIELRPRSWPRRDDSQSSPSPPPTSPEPLAS